MKAYPFVKWAGGKRQSIKHLLESMPSEYNNYFEPFVGGGALLFELLPKSAVINDVNHELFIIYKCFFDDEFYELMVEEIKKHENAHSEEYYYQVRDMDKKPRFELEPSWKRAARALYLNKACFNGLYRVNSKGYFNVPSAKKEHVKAYDEENFENIHNYFKNNAITILDVDFVEAVRTAKNGDFIYFDPPYDSYEDKDTFTSYTKYNFDKNDQIRLAELFKELTTKGVKCMLSNHNTNLIRSLYEGFNIKVISARRMINSNAQGRGEVEEVIITNY